MSSQAQIIATNGNTVIINNFDTSDQVYLNQNLGYGAYPWGNWFGAAYSNVVWSASDAGAPGDNPGSGSMLIQSYFPDGGVGGANGTQFVVFNGFGAFQPPFNGYGTLLTNVEVVTNFSCDIRFDPVSASSGGNFPTVEFGTYGNDTNYGQYDFGSITIPSTNLNWVHVSIPVTANSIWTNIPSVYVKIFSAIGATGSNVPVYLYVDNLEFQLGVPNLVQPTAGAQKTSSALRIFANGSQYARTQIATVDTNQSWVGGAYPVSYSFNISGYDPALAINEFHAFWIPLNWNSGTLNQYSDYSTAQNTMRLIITQGVAGTGSNAMVVAQLAWKTNLLNSNPVNVMVGVSNSTIVGTWTVTFNSATTGTLTAPGSSPVPFTFNDANLATDFGNPMVFEFGMQPDPTTSIGTYVDVTHAQTVNVATGVPVNSDLTTGSINTNIWLTGSVSQTAAALVSVNAANTPLWVYWTTPDIGFALATKADIGNKTIPWKTPNFYANYPSNGLSALSQGSYKWELIPTAALPTVDGTSNGVKSASAFFLLQNPVPAQ